MNPRHAAALVLCGWYLMMPPPYWSKTNPRTAPLRQWTVFGRYDSARECSDERTKMIRVQSMALLSDLAEGCPTLTDPASVWILSMPSASPATTRASRQNDSQAPASPGPRLHRARARRRPLVQLPAERHALPATEPFPKLPQPYSRREASTGRRSCECPRIARRKTIDGR